jgi:hypothetical protein
MREEQQEARARDDRDRLKRSGADLDKRFPVALALYALLGVLVWFTMGEGNVLVYGKPVEMRLIPLIIIGGLALRTVLARSAEKIRRGGENNSS